MLLKDAIKTATSGITANTSRSILTILGIVIGIASIILIASIGGVAEEAIVGELGGLGAETIIIRPGQHPKSLNNFADILFTESLKQRELDALRNKVNVPQAIAVEPEVFAPYSASYRG